MSGGERGGGMTKTDRIKSAAVEQLETIYLRRARSRCGMGGLLNAQRSKINYLHIDLLIKAGLSKREASATLQHCNDIAMRNARLMGVQGSLFPGARP